MVTGWGGGLGRSLSLAHLHRGELGPAAGTAEETLEACQADWDLCLPMTATLPARAHASLGDLDAAERALRACPDSAGENLERAAARGAGHLALARGEYAPALTAFRTAGAVSGDEAGAPPTLVAWRSGGALAAAGLGQREYAVKLANAEVGLARQIGARRALGAALRAAGLVAGLAACGLRTPEIARRLHLSAKTVAWHLDHVYRKLGITSRHRLRTALSPG